VFTRSRLPALFASPWVVAILMATVIRPADAQILTRTTQRPSENWNPTLPLTIGAALEFETNKEESAYNFPLLVEYNFSESVKLSLEPTFVYVRAKTKDVQTVGGAGDLETSLEWEFLHERRYRPALTAVGVVKWPTASSVDLGTPNWDYGIGSIASKDLVLIDLDVGLLYTFSGDPDQQDTLEISIAGEYPLRHTLAIEFETVGSLGKDILFGQSTNVGGGGFNLEGTVGLGWLVTRYLKLEGGVTLRDDGTQQYTFGWVYSLAGEY
jgi:hypothetical protein